MNAQELRIGNYIHAGTGENDEPLFCKVRAIYESYIVWDGTTTQLEYVKPVLLTPEILEKAGFKFDKITWELGRFSLAEYKHGFHVYLHGLSAGTTTQVFFLHQLQNLIFSVTGIELKVDI